jgi:group I intron endonuclease
MIGIYKIQSCVKPNRIYIGSSTNISTRWRKHINELYFNKHCNSKLQNHYNKYGIADLQFSILVECDINDILEIEQSFLDSFKPFFNVCKIAGRTTGYKHPESVKIKMRKPKSEEHKKKLSIAKQGCIPWNKGRTDLPPHSEETKRKQSLGLKGKPKNRTKPVSKK